MSLNYDTTRAPATQAGGVSTRELARAAWASSLGSALEYYDFALYSLASALVFSPLFFPGSNPATGLILSFGTYFLGFAIRPLGGIIFGRLGDRLGRKFVLLATVLLMGGAKGDQSRAEGGSLIPLPPPAVASMSDPEQKARVRLAYSSPGFALDRVRIGVPLGGRNASRRENVTSGCKRRCAQRACPASSSTIYGTVARPCA